MSASRTTPIAPPATIGLVGGGPFARDVVLAARTMGYSVTVLDPDAVDPAGRAAQCHLVAALDDIDALDDLAAACAVVTIGHPSVPPSTLRRLAEQTLVHPSATAVENCADTSATLEFLRRVGAPLADDRLDPATIDRHLSLTLARTADGRTACYAATDDHLLEGRLDVAVVPANLGRGGQSAAERLGTGIAERLGLVGVLTVEMVVVGTTVLVRGLVPCPSAHAVWTLDACQTSQATQAVRAICGLGLGDPHLVVPAAATAVLHTSTAHDTPANWAKVLHHDTAHLHLYGDGTSDAHRPSGHLTVTSGTAPVAANLARRLRSLATGR